MPLKSQDLVPSAVPATHAVKSPNYLVADHWGVKVSDFNLSRLLDNGLSSSSGGPLNPVWLVRVNGWSSL